MIKLECKRVKKVQSYALNAYLCAANTHERWFHPQTLEIVLCLAVIN